MNRRAVLDHPLFVPLLVLVLAELVSFRLFAPFLGFYHDGWLFLEMAERGGGLLGAVGQFAADAHFWPRPLEILQLPLFYRLARPHPVIGQVLLGCLGILEAGLLFVLLGRLVRSRSLALTAALLALTIPNRSVLHLWLANSPQPVTLCLTLASLLCHLEWVEKRGVRWLAAGQALYLAGMLEYESAAFMPLLLAGGLLARRRSEGEPWSAAARSTAIDLLPYLPSFLAAAAWQRVGVVHLIGGYNPKVIAPSAGHFFKAMGAGFECVTNRVVHVCATSIGPALRYYGAPALLLGGLAAAALAWVGRSGASGGADKAARRTLLGACAGAFLGAYLPYALSGSYVPQIYGIMSRTNGAGAWAGGMLLAAAVSLIPPSRRLLSAGALLLFLAPFTWSNWHAASDWRRSWEEQTRILDGVSREAAKISGTGTILLAGVPMHVGRAIVFDAAYDFDSALRLKTGRGELSGNVLSPRMRFVGSEAVETLDGKTVRRHPYGTLWVYDAGRDTLERYAPGVLPQESGRSFP